MDRKFPSIVFILISFYLHIAFSHDFLDDIDHPIGDILNQGSDQQNFIVHVERPLDLEQLLPKPEEWVKFMESLFSSSLMGNGPKQNDDLGVAAQQLLYTYHNIMTGFSARLSKTELEKMSKMPWFVHAYPDRKYQLQTTRSPQFLGLRHQDNAVWRSNMGEGIIIGVLDTGIDPDHPSFSDEGMPPPPAKWKGFCDFKNASICNNKLIGARSFVDPTSKDTGGHGTHTASTAAGNFVKHANAYGLAEGIASGMAPRAHIAVYKVCDDSGCDGLAILKAMDAAISDGVDILSLSLGFAGGDSTTLIPFEADPCAIGAFGAVKHGVVVSTSAGNDGPAPGTLSNEAPWVLTVAASTMDRAIRTTVKLGNGEEFQGESLYQQPQTNGSRMVPLVYFGNTENSSRCINGSLDGYNVEGKIVVCDNGVNGRVVKGKVVKAAKGAGMILVNIEDHGYSTLADLHVLPTSHVSFEDGSKIKKYISSANNAAARIANKGTILHQHNSPSMAYFSARGPSLASPGILKPDITAPGVNVLGAWPSGLLKTSVTDFNIESGTSMSCPHVSGIAALIKKAHTDWSPAAIKSAIMTTAYSVDDQNQTILNEKRQPADYLATGAGHVDPRKALDPGLVYDLKIEDYIPYVCGLGYTDKQVRSILHQQVSCESVGKITEGELNYPSITVPFKDATTSEIKYKRTVTNVGDKSSSYTIKIEQPDGVSVSVEPSTLEFTDVNQKKEFTVTFKKTSDRTDASQGRLIWTSEKHVVRSPIYVNFI